MRARPWFVLTLSAALLAAAAHAAPLPSPRAAAEPAVRAISDVSRRAESNASPSARSLRRTVGCAASIDALHVHAAEWLARGPQIPLATTHTRDIGGIAVLEDDGSFFYTNSGGQPHLDIASVARAYARTHADQPDQLAIYLASGLDQWLGSPGALAAAWVVRNDVAGIGLGLYDLTGALGIPSRLSALLTMNGLHRYPDDPDAPIGGPGDTFSTMDVLAHEFGHRWLSYTFLDSAGTTSTLLLGRDLQHWGFFFDSEGSFMEGCEWQEVAPDSFVTMSVSERFGSLDQYLMGVRTRAEMDSLLIIDNPTDLSPAGHYIPTSIPQVGVSCDGRAVRWSVADIERVHGVRLPASTSGGDTVRVAFVLVTPRGAAATPADLAKLGVIQDRFASTISVATEGRMSIDLDMDPLAGAVTIDHLPLLDSEQASVPRLVSARIAIGEGSRPHAIDPASVRLHWRTDSLGPEQSLAMNPSSPDQFSALLPGFPLGTRVGYRVTASSDSASVPGWLALGAQSPLHAFSIGLDTSAPLVRHTPVRAQGRTRLPQSLLARATDGVGVDSLWAEIRVGAGPTLLLPGTRAGADSFTVALGGTHAEGTRIAYRLVARDRALAANLGYSNASWDTLLVIDDWIEDFENPTPWFTFNVLYSWRTLWHISRRDSLSGPAGGEFAWHSGSRDGTEYPPHVDGALYSPLIPSLPPGSRLRFEHRHDLEQRDAMRAWDGARVEISLANGPWQIALPIGGYSHTQSGSGQPFAAGSPCWSGSSPWRETIIDLSPYAPGPVRLRFRMTADDFLGGEGWWVDRVRVEFPGGVTLDAPQVAAGELALGSAWPYPATSTLHQAIHLTRAQRLTWTLHDLQGRVLAPLHEGLLPPGRHTLTAALPSTLSSGIYFARVLLDGAPLGVRRVAILR